MVIWRTIAISLLLLVSLVAPGFSQDNLVQNGSFLDLVPWQWENVDRADLYQRDSREGPTSGRLWRRQPGEGYWVQEISGLKSGSRYQLSAYVRVQHPTDVYLGLEITTPEGIAYRGIMERVTPQQGWTRLEHSFQGTTATGVRLLAGGTFHGQILWDEISLQRQETPGEKEARHLQALWDEHGYLYTGLIIDARGLRMQRSMSPRIVAEDGREIYGHSFVPPEIVTQRGVAGYVRQMEQAVIHPLLSVSPEFPYTLGLVIPALEVFGPARTSVIISNEGADRILAWTELYDFLGAGRVIFVID